MRFLHIYNSPVRKHCGNRCFIPLISLVLLVAALAVSNLFFTFPNRHQFQEPSDKCCVPKGSDHSLKELSKNEKSEVKKAARLMLGLPAKVPKNADDMEDQDAKQGQEDENDSEPSKDKAEKDGKDKEKDQKEEKRKYEDKVKAVWGDINVGYIFDVMKETMFNLRY
ncbi:hypothetical protein ACP70R_028121 [Stipagrostis hirtigluma subsp. patula]